jgi:hypothetical protein
VQGEGNGVERKDPYKDQEEAQKAAHAEIKSQASNTETGSEAFSVSELIRVPDRDISPLEMMRILQQVCRVTNLLAANIIRNAVFTDKEFVAGIGHPIVQALLNCAVQSDSARMGLEQMEQQRRQAQQQVLMPGRPVGMPTRGRN